ncbi:unnamed protein product [Sphagnum balticum]
MIISKKSFVKLTCGFGCKSKFPNDARFVNRSQHQRHLTLAKPFGTFFLQAECGNKKLMENTGGRNFATADLCSRELSSLVCVIVD